MADLPQDPYRVLGIPPTATDAEITAVYHRRARELHPDIHDNSDLDELRRVLAAYQRVRELRQSASHPADHDRPEHQHEPYRFTVREPDRTTVPVRVRQSRPSREPELRAGPVRRHRR